MIMVIIKNGIQVYSHKSYCNLHTWGYTRVFCSYLQLLHWPLLSCCALTFVIMLRSAIQEKKDEGNNV